MRRLRIAASWGGALLALNACATLPLDHYLAGPRTVPIKAEVEGVPFIQQDRDQCGPASAAMVISWAGRPITADELSEKMFTPGKRGTMQHDMLGAARREGFLAIPIRGHDPLFKEVAAGHPVLVFQNLGLSWFPVWHYAVVTGYDLEQERMRLHSNRDNNRYHSLNSFDREWEGGDYWGAVILPPTELSASADEVDHLQAAAGIERAERASAAETAYRTILRKWPRSLGAHVGLGNVLFASGQADEATVILRRASGYHPKSAEVWHNLAIAYRGAKKTALAKRSARQAVRLASAEDSPLYRQSLGTLLN